MFRYGLDFRLLTPRRLAIIDATQTLERIPSQAQPPITHANSTTVLTPIPHIEAIASRLVAERQSGYLISLVKGALVSFDEDGARIGGVGVRFVELVVRVLTMGETGLA